MRMVMVKMMMIIDIVARLSMIFFMFSLPHAPPSLLVAI